MHVEVVTLHGAAEEVELAVGPTVPNRLELVEPAVNGFVVHDHRIDEAVDLFGRHTDHLDRRWVRRDVLDE